jgi:hypothetical protein
MQNVARTSARCAGARRGHWSWRRRVRHPCGDATGATGVRGRGAPLPPAPAAEPSLRRALRPSSAAAPARGPGAPATRTRGAGSRRPRARPARASLRRAEVARPRRTGASRRAGARCTGMRSPRRRTHREERRALRAGSTAGATRTVPVRSRPRRRARDLRPSNGWIPMHSRCAPRSKRRARNGTSQVPVPRSSRTAEWRTVVRPGRTRGHGARGIRRAQHPSPTFEALRSATRAVRGEADPRLPAPFIARAAANPPGPCEAVSSSSRPTASGTGYRSYSSTGVSRTGRRSWSRTTASVPTSLRRRDRRRRCATRRA